MDTVTPHGEESVPFKRPTHFLSDLDASVAAEILASAADVALLIEGGVIRDIALGSSDLVEEGYALAWRDKPWVDTVTADSRRKIEELLSGSGEDRVRWRHVNHPSSSALDVPIKYTAISMGKEGRMLALGRDLRAMSALQQRLVEAHQSLERDYSRLREAEARYKLLFDAVSEPVLIVNTANLVIEEANGAAKHAFDGRDRPLVGAALTELIAGDHRRAVDVMSAQALASGAARTAMIELSSGRSCVLAASAFREDRASRLIVRLIDEPSSAGETASRLALLDTLERLPDGLIVVDAELRIRAANLAFKEMVKVAGDTQTVGDQLSDYLGRSPTDLNVLISTLRSHGVMRNFATVLRDRFGGEEAVEVSAVSAPSKDGSVYGLSIRNVSRRLQSGAKMSEQLPRSVDQLTELVGRVPLKDIVRESTELIEKLCIEAALEITEHNRASAAEMLGLSRQGLYSKLKRAGIDTRS